MTNVRAASQMVEFEDYGHLGARKCYAAECDSKETGLLRLLELVAGSIYRIFLKRAKRSNVKGGDIE
jgi:hypothetical protein